MAKIPTTNNAGETRKFPCNVNDILENDNFTFKAAIVKKFMKEKEYPKFVENYLKNRTMRSLIPLSPAEIRIIQKFESGVINIHELRKELDSDNMTDTLSKLGRYHVFKKQENN